MASKACPMDFLCSHLPQILSCLLSLSVLKWSPPLPWLLWSLHFPPTILITFVSCLLIIELLRSNFWIILISICLHNLRILRLDQFNGIDPKSYFASPHSSLLQTMSLVRWTCQHLKLHGWKQIPLFLRLVSLSLSLTSISLFWSSRLNTFSSRLLASLFQLLCSIVHKVLLLFLHLFFIMETIPSLNVYEFVSLISILIMLRHAIAVF